MKLTTLGAYLVGSRRAIEALAASRWALPVGALLVVSGGLARYYDGAYLPAEWPVLLHGFTVSSLNALVLYALVRWAVRSRRRASPGAEPPPPRPFWRGYRSFLGLFWMTAPMAWLYAVPYERFMTPIEAMNANLWTLAAVSAWRVLLMSRVLSVLLDAAVVPVFFLVMVFADAALFTAAALMPKPVLDLMGGLQQTEIERAVAVSAFLVQFYGVLTAPVWLLGAAIAGRWLKTPRRGREPSVELRRGEPLPRGVVGFACAAVIAWAPALAVTQREQRLRHRAEELLTSGRVAEAMEEMSAHQRREYPPVWDPPPRIGYRETAPSVAAVRAALVAREPAAVWVRDVFLEKSWREVVGWFPIWREATAAAMRASTAMNGCPERAREGLEFHLAHDPRLTEAEREDLRAVLASGRPD